MLNSLAYDIMFSIAHKQLSCGNSVIVDCPLARPSLYVRGRALALQVGATRREQVGCFAERCGKKGVLAQNNAGIAVIECLPSDAREWRRRLEARAREGSPGQSHKPQSWTAVTELRAKCVSCAPPAASMPSAAHRAALCNRQPAAGTRAATIGRSTGRTWSTTCCLTPPRAAPWRAPLPRWQSSASPGSSAAGFTGTPDALH